MPMLMPVRPGLVATPSCPFFSFLLKECGGLTFLFARAHANARAPYLRHAHANAHPLFFVEGSLLPSSFPFFFLEVGLAALPAVRFAFMLQEGGPGRPAVPHIHTYVRRSDSRVFAVAPDLQPPKPLSPFNESLLQMARKKAGVGSCTRACENV